MFSTDRAQAPIRVALVGVFVASIAFTSIVFSSHAEAQRVEVEAAAIEATADMRVARFAAAAGAAGWVLDKVYDTGKEFGRSLALKSVRPDDKLELDDMRVEQLLD